MTDQTQTTTEPVLLPCLFCGGEAHTLPASNVASITGCATSTDVCPVSPRVHARHAESVTAWNTRTTPQPLAIGLDREAVARRIYENRPANILHPENRVITWDEAPELVPDRIAQIYRDTDAILALAAPAEGWQGIETAPKDGTTVLAAHSDYADGIMDCVLWSGGRWETQEGIGYMAGRFTHWMPLPAAPTGETGA